MTNEFDVIEQELTKSNYCRCFIHETGVRVKCYSCQAFAALATLRAKSAEQEAEVQRLRTELAEANEAREGWLTQARTLEPLLPTWRAGDPIITAAAERIDTLSNECATQRGIISECKDMLAARAVRVERLEAALRSVQWGIDVFCSDEGTCGVTYHLCPLCDQVEARGHAPDCLVGMALKEGE